MQRLFQTLILISLSTWLLGCDITPVSVDTWDIQIGSGNELRSAVWKINQDGSINIDGEEVATIQGVILEGSKIYWTDEMPDPTDPSAPNLPVNFNGTVDGSRLAGTLFTTLGNSTVTGVRQQ